MDDGKADPDKKNDEAQTAGKASAASSDTKADDAGVADNAKPADAAQPSDDGESPPSEPKATASKDSAESSEDGTSKDDAESKDAESKDAESKDAESKDAESKDAESKDAESKDAGKSDSGEPDGDESKKDEKHEEETWTNTIAWVVGIVLVLSIELFIYGHNGFIRVCVGVDTLTDYSLKNEPRTRENAKGHPFCAERLNLGMWTSSEELSKEALADACNGAARVVGMEHKQPCLRKDKPWTREVEMEQVLPWDPRLYRRLLFLE